ncbi:dynein assembly factor 3, axonemal homolog [Cajanus cajan]|uniref:dynein assembly factor 3, axonemal homolog n=1 Tax=Cajanus cajan TaxID=3821 RepID=UPI00098DB875|nr:dynein assembly factor 3, axonemal homolog [Cajanus cajan]
MAGTHVAFDMDDTGAVGNESAGPKNGAAAAAGHDHDDTQAGAGPGGAAIKAADAVAVLNFPAVGALVVTADALKHGDAAAVAFDAPALAETAACDTAGAGAEAPGAAPREAPGPLISVKNPRKKKKAADAANLISKQGADAAAVELYATALTVAATTPLGAVAGADFAHNPSPNHAGSVQHIGDDALSTNSRVHGKDGDGSPVIEPATGLVGALEEAADAAAVVTLMTASVKEDLHDASGALLVTDAAFAPAADPAASQSATDAAEMEALNASWIKYFQARDAAKGRTAGLKAAQLWHKAIEADAAYVERQNNSAATEAGSHASASTKSANRVKGVATVTSSVGTATEIKSTPRASPSKPVLIIS